MPIEIREVVIRAVVDPSASEGQSGSAGGGGNSSSSGGSAGETVAEAVKKVFEMLRDKEER